MLSEDLQRNLDGRVRALEQDCQRLLLEIGALLGRKHRARVRIGSDKFDVAFAALDDLIYADPDDPDLEVERIYRMSDELIAVRAELDRERRTIRRRQEGIAIDRREMEERQRADEMEAELSRVEGRS